MCGDHCRHTVAGGAPVALTFDFLIIACGTRNTAAWPAKTSRAAYKASLAATRAAKDSPLHVSTGRPIHKASLAVVWAL